MHTRFIEWSPLARVGQAHSPEWAYLIRAGRDPCPERDATLDTPESRPSSKATRISRAMLLEALEQGGSNISSKEGCVPRSEETSYPERSESLT